MPPPGLAGTMHSTAIAHGAAHANRHAANIARSVTALMAGRSGATEMECGGKAVRHGLVSCVFFFNVGACYKKSLSAGFQ
ncbi:hypothetical protein Herbaro_20875 [Herbaspirillum sp. WKF16]|uniref:hypothetical protein n=1 Tax=Herbaspirillum sp. WKF16 TaxID=3028312 RepID=UPI0023A917FB|nr:hypothetical protein [Herbaspirillum sp. WKF16]WDZ98512.1 hypothetical protein Herbaro_20875 [Herbaspirillum sp. WKF16]